MFNRFYDFIIKKHVEILTVLFVFISIVFLFQTENYIILKIQNKWEDTHASIRKPVSSTQHKKQLIVQNKQLRKEVFRLQSELNSTRYLQEENNRLRKLLAYEDTASYSLTAAQIVYKGYKSGNHVIVLDKGKKQEISNRDVVVDHKGLVGRISNVGVSSSMAGMITEPNSRVSVRIIPSGSFGLLKWHQGNTFTIEDIPITVKVETGYSVITSGYSDIYPENIPVGKITRVEASTNGFTYLVYGEYYVDFYKLKEVLVLHES